eukprot:scaffold3854_cov95-Cylindrotheca_fusiformis.AAC.1
MLALAFAPNAESTKLKLFQRTRHERVQVGQSSDHQTPELTMGGTVSSLSDLAHDFDQALVAVNRNKEDIHVGNLLTACERLEATIRRMGFSTSANDIANNMAKIRSTYDKLPSSVRDSMPAVLQYEQNSGITSPDKIKESSATMGFLWLGRSINYQYDMFRYMLEHPEASPYDAANHAYVSTVKPHLSWPLQKLGQAALSSIRPIQTKTILAKMVGYREDQYNSDVDRATKKDMRQIKGLFSSINTATDLYSLASARQFLFEIQQSCSRTPLPTFIWGVITRRPSHFLQWGDVYAIGESAVLFVSPHY